MGTEIHTKICGRQCPEETDPVSPLLRAVKGTAMRETNRTRSRSGLIPMEIRSDGFGRLKGLA